LSDQVCVEGRCRHEESVVAGELLATAAREQAAAGDDAGALELYEQAFEAFGARGVPVPPEISCGAAALELRTATEAPGREQAASRADLCFRTTFAGDAQRALVLHELAKLRFDGLDVTLFDRQEPAAAFFTQQPTRPTMEALTIDVQMADLPGRETPEHTASRVILQGEQGRAAIGQCFLRDWETRHARSAAASLAFAYNTRLVDLGARDTYETEIAIRPNGTAQDGFEACLTTALPSLFDVTNNRALQGGSPWAQTVQVSVRLP
jgi:hypothetical protein